ncbi:AAA family ATPase [Burkholderia gladioli]|uniref:AAA family ATPase n=1 Tax=Burkholderia gladioli TaxID=28095 RepID=UPI0022D41ECD|nr:AAA family ATPase [Burkholderia gladioli]MDA0576003.1 AAA family ATPase [Burkholderia gladioli]MDA0604172.1 AAA family ATPase [Burkholderia gladioli]
MSKDSFEDWLAERPRWLQTAAARLLGSQRAPEDKDINALADLCLAEASKDQAAVFEKIPTGAFAAGIAALSIRLSKIEKVNGVNAIRSDATLDFDNKDFAIVYGPNGAGKSGFARLVKNACGARTRTDLLPNVFLANPIEPSAEFLVTHNGKSEVIGWTAATGPAGKLRHIHVFDSAVAASYVNDKNVASYEPRRMRFISALIDISERVVAELTRRKGALPTKLPQIPPDHTDTKSGLFWAAIKPTTTRDAIEAACIWTDADSDQRLKIENSLKQQDISGRLKELERQKKLLAQLESEVKSLRDPLSDDKLLAILNARRDAAEKRKAASDDAERVFANAPLDGVGKQSWRLMWEQARQYSEEQAYPKRLFPAVDDNEDKCVLCQQPLDEAARSRLSDFEAYVKGGLETSARAAEKLRDTLIKALPAMPSVDKWRLDVGLVKIEAIDADSLLGSIQARREAAEIAALGTELPSINWVQLDDGIAALTASLGKEGAILTELQKDGKKAEHEKALKELRAREWIAQQKAALDAEIQRRGVVQNIENAIRLAGTHALTRKKNDLADEELAKGYQERFLAEISVLGGKRLLVSPEPLQEGKGRISFTLTLRDTKQNAAAHAVLSEGESRIVALAAFLADITGSGQPTPFVFDDPISSLDQEFEERVADRLVELSRTRQVIVFTHRLSLLALLEDALDKASKNAATTGGTFPSRAFISLRRLGTLVGMVDTLDVRRERPDKGFAKLRDHRLPVLRKLLDGGDAGYDNEMKAVCGDFRILVERSVEKVMLSGLIERFRRSVQTQQIRSLAKITPEDCVLVDQMMTKYSKFEHSHSDEVDANLPGVEELAADLKLMIDWIGDFDKRAVA